MRERGTGLAADMKNTAAFRRTAAAAGLLTTALLMLVSTILAPPFPGNPTDKLAEIAAAGASATISAFTFTLAQLPFIVAILGVAHLIRTDAPILSNLGAILGVVGGFGHSVFGGVSMVQLSMATDEANRAVHVSILDAVEAGPAVAFMAMGLLGTVLGILLLAIGLWRASVGPRWVPLTLGAFLVTEFVGSGLAEWASLLAVLLYVVAFGALAATTWRSPNTAWETFGRQTTEPHAVGQRA